MEEQHQTQGRNLLWKSIWNISVPEKVKVFLWKCCHEALPVRAVLHRRRISPANICGFCNQNPETVSHALLQCPWTSPIWFGSQLQVLPNSNVFPTFDLWLLFMIGSLKALGDYAPIGLRILALTVWGIWKERNDSFFNNRPPNPSATTIRVKALISEEVVPLQQIQNQNTRRRGENSNLVVWRAPPAGSLKLNVDAAFNQSTGKGAVAVVIRDEGGVRLLTHSRRISAPSPLVAESIAAREALILALNLDLDNILVESDNLGLVNCICKHKSEWSIAPVLQDIQSLKSQFRSCIFTWTAREGNSQAHDLAQAAMAGAQAVWMRRGEG